MNWRNFLHRLRAALAPGDLEQAHAESRGMDRRTFLRFVGTTAALGTAAAAVGLDAERLLWTPDDRVIAVDWGRDVDFSAAGVTRRSGNSFLTIDLITREALKVLEGNLAFAKSLNRTYDGMFNPGERTFLAARRAGKRAAMREFAKLDPRLPERYRETYNRLSIGGFTPPEGNVILAPVGKVWIDEPQKVGVITNIGRDRS